MKYGFLLAACMAPTLAWGNVTVLLDKTGTDLNGKSCQVTVENFYGTQMLNIMFNDYKFVNLPMKLDATGGIRFDVQTMDNGDGVYSRVIGAAITIANIGLLQVRGTSDLNSAGQISKVELRAKGGAFNWWRRNFACRDLR